MEKFIESIIKYGLNLGVDSVYEAIQTELNQEKNIGSEIANIFVEKGYRFLKTEIQQLWFSLILKARQTVGFFVA